MGLIVPTENVKESQRGTRPMWEVRQMSKEDSGTRVQILALPLGAPISFELSFGFLGW